MTAQVTPLQRHPSTTTTMLIAIGVLATTLATLAAPLVTENVRPAVSRQPVSMPSAQALAAQAFLARRYADAYGRFAALADEGDADAASMALMMVTHGPTLFGSDWYATPGQIQRWSALAQRHAQQRGAQIVEVSRGD